MYKYYRTVGLATIASPTNHNLALLDVDEHLTADTLAVTHGGYINVIPIINTTRHSKYVSLLNGPGRGSGIVKEVKWLRIKGETMFIVLSTEGLQIYDAEVTEIKYKHCCKDRGDGNDYAIGACVIKGTMLCVGTSSGCIWVFTCDESNTKFAMTDRIFGHDNEITLLDGSGEFMVSASKDNAYIWINQNSSFHITRKLHIDGLNAPATCLKYCNYTVFLGYETGELCTFDTFERKLNTRTIAHKLSVTGVDFSLLKYFVLTTSSDCYAKIWSFSKDKVKAELKCVFNIFNNEGPICGGGFLNYSCTEFCIVTANQLGVQFFIRDYKVSKTTEQCTGDGDENCEDNFETY